MKRIDRIIETVRNAINGDFSARIETSGKNDDIDRLANVINQLVEIVRKYIADRGQTETVLRVSEERYRRLKANIPGMVYLFAMHPNGTFSFPYVNDASKQLFDISVEDLMRDVTLITSLIHPDDRERFESSVKFSAETLRPRREVLRYIVNGEIRWYDCMSRPERQPNGDVLWDGIILEVTDRMKAEESLRKSQEELSDIIAASPVGIAIYDSSGQCISTNDSLARIIGATKEQVLEQNLNRIESWKKTGLLDLSREAVRTRSVKRHEVMTTSSFGREVFLDCHLVPFGDNGLLLMIQDITERKRAEEAIHQSETQFKTLFMSLSDGFYLSEIVFDDNGNPCDYRYVEVNPKFEQIMGLTRDQIIGKRYKELVPVDTTEWFDVYCTVARTGIPLTYEFYSNEYQMYFETYSYQPAKGQVSVFVRNVTERKRAAAVLSESEATLRSIYESSPMLIGVVELTEDDKIFHLYDNPATARFFNIPYRGTKHKTADELGAPSDAIHEWLVAYRKSQQQNGPVRFEYIHHAPDGPLWLSATVSVIGPGRDGRTRFSYVAEDITKRKHAEEKLSHSERFLNNIIDQNPYPIWIADAQGTLIRINSACCALLNIRKEDVINKYNILKDDIVIEQGHLPLVQSVFSKGEIVNFTITYDSSRLKQLELSGYANVILDATISPVKDESDIITNAVIVHRDITVQRRLEEQLLQSQKIEAIGRLAGGIAHDFNNMLSVILGHAELLKSSLPSGDPLLKSVLDIETAGLHSRDITRQLLAFSRKQIIAPKTSNLNKLLENIRKTLAKLIGENIDLRFFPQMDLWNVRIDPAQVDQILFNLAANARDAMPEGGTLTIETSNVDLDAAYCALHLECRPGQYVVLSVADDGVGMDKETLSHVFEPFWTTKEVGKGTGLGLATVYGVARQNGGFVTVYSEPGKGTSFSIHIPRLMDEVQKEEVVVIAPPEFHPATVLLVEDDDMVRGMTAALLNNFGYSVVLAENPAEALAIFEKEASPIDLLITDVVMPQMSGAELVSKIKEIKQDVKVLFMSGYTENIIVRQGILKEGIHFIQKPFSMNDFSRKVREALDK